MSDLQETVTAARKCWALVAADLAWVERYGGRQAKAVAAAGVEVDRLLATVERSPPSLTPFPLGRRALGLT